jgi:pimeloyl-ACP methyl ester carboxylesterase
MFDQGSGPPLILIPGVQGRWEWMLPAVRSLQKRCRTISYSLCGDIGSGLRLDPRLGFENYVRQLDSIFERASIDRAALCGVSYGAFVALRYAAMYPERVSALVLVSAPAPGWAPSERQRRYIARPWLSAPLFVLASPLRIWPEIHTAFRDWRSRLNFAITHGLRVLGAPMVPAIMAERVMLQQTLDFAPDCERVRAPTLIVTGEERLDSVVPVHVTQTYRTLIPGSQYEMMDRTGHIGMVTQPERFAEIVCTFVHAHDH